MGQARSSTPRPRRAGRADCSRFASPAEALEGWRLGGFEVLTLVSIDWLVGWLIVCLANVTQLFGYLVREGESKFAK